MKFPSGKRFGLEDLMKRNLPHLCLVLICLICAPWCRAAKASPRVDVIVGDTAPELERFAAGELCNYLAKLYGIRAYPARTLSDSSEMVFLIGGPETNATVKQAAQPRVFPKLT